MTVSRLNLVRASILLLLLWPVLSFSQALSARSKQIKNAYEELENDTGSKKNQLTYLHIFPTSSKEFKEIFDPKDFGQLYNDSYKYIEAFVKLDKYYPMQVIDKAVDIGKNLIWDADATGQIQQEIVNMGNKYIAVFIKKLESLASNEKAKLITFLADVENHKAYPEYQQLIQSLDNNGQHNLAKQFTDARSRREAENNH